MSSLPITGLSANALALEPQSVRNGGAAAQNAYQEGLAFENVLVNELAQQLSQTVPGLSGGSSSSDGLGGSSSGSSSDPLSGSSLGPYSSLLTQALGDGLMSGGGTGVAMQIARALDPALNHPTSSAQSSGTPAQPPSATGTSGGATP